jgi:hypothetical protein
MGEAGTAPGYVPKIGKDGVDRGNKYNSTVPIRVYQLRSQGCTQHRICKVLGINTKTWITWKEKPEVAAALEMARKPMAKHRAPQEFATFRDYVYDKLPEELKDLWDEIDACQDAKDCTARVNALLSGTGKRVRQHLFMHALVQKNFNSTEAMSMLGLHPNLIDRWKATDPKFKRLIEQIHHYKKDFFESALIKLVKGGDTAATIFANKTYNADRGYSDKLRVEHKIKGKVKVQVEMTVVPVESLQLTKEQKRAALEKIREERKLALKPGVTSSQEDIDDAEILE